MRDNLGLDYRLENGAPNPLNSGGGYVVMDIPMPGQLAGHVRVPKSAEGYVGGSDTLVEAGPPNTGSGLICGVDGVIRRENHLGRVFNAQNQLVDASRDMPTGTTLTLRSDTGSAISRIRLQRYSDNEYVWIEVPITP